MRQINHDKSYLLKEYLVKHIKFKHKNSEAGKWICNICHKEFAQQGILIIHRRKHEMKECFCKTCGKKFANEYTLQFHTRSHDEVMTIECEVCKKQINTHHLNNGLFDTFC